MGLALDGVRFEDGAGEKPSEPAQQSSAEGTAESQVDGSQVMHAARQLFDEADMNMNGTLSSEEIGQLVWQFWQRLGVEGIEWAHLEREVQRILEEFDKDANGSIDFGEFLEMLTYLEWQELLPVEVQEEMRVVSQEWAQVLRVTRGIFDSADVDKNGVIDAQELGGLVRLAYAKLQPGVELSGDDVAQEVAHILSEFDLDHNGVIDYGERELPLRESVRLGHA